MKTDLRYQQAIHEAGHAVLLYYLNDVTCRHADEPFICLGEHPKISVGQHRRLSATAVTSLQHALCAGEMAELLFYEKAGAVHIRDRGEMLRLEAEKRKALDLPPLAAIDEESLIERLKSEAYRLLLKYNCRDLIKVVADALIKYEALSIAQFMAVLIEYRGAMAMPDTLCFFRRHDDDRPMTRQVRCDDELHPDVLIGIAYRYCDYALYRDYPDVNGDYVYDQIDARSLLQRSESEFLALNPSIQDGEYTAVRVHKIARLLAEYD